MNFIKDYLVTIILVLLIIVGIFGIGMFCYNSLYNENAETNLSAENLTNAILTNNINQRNILKDTNEVKENVSNNTNIVKSTNYINMSKYKLNSSYGKIAEIYNIMIDSFVKNKLIISTSTGSECKKSTLNPSKGYFFNEYDDFYESWAYTNSMIKKYKYTYSLENAETESESAWWLSEMSDFIMFAVDLKITNTDYTWQYEYNENVLRNGHQCYELIAIWNGDYTSAVTDEFVYHNGIDKYYIDMNTYELIEKEISFSNTNNEYSTYNMYFEYSNDEFQLPQEVETYFFK